MVKDAEDWHGLQTTKLKNLGNCDTAPLMLSYTQRVWIEEVNLGRQVNPTWSVYKGKS